MESKEKVKDRPVLQSMPSIQVTSPLSEYDCEPDLWDVDSDSEKEMMIYASFRLMLPPGASRYFSQTCVRCCKPKDPLKNLKKSQINNLLDDSASFHELKESKENDCASNPYPKEAVRVAKRRDQSSYSFRPSVNPSETSIFLFPGQGTQFVGMGKKVLDLPQVRELFLAANDILKFDLLNMCLEGPKSQLDKTMYAQPAIYVTSLAAVEAVRENNPRAVEGCVATAGFSLGEITALTFAGAFSFETGLKLVQIRAEAMQYASDLTPSGMMTVFFGADAKLGYALNLAKEWCIRQGIEDPECCVSNYLYPGSKIIAGNEEALHFIEKNASDFNIRKLKRLTVSGAFHTKLMQDAVSPFSEAINRAEVQNPLVPVHSNVDGKMYRDVKHIKRQLPRQILTSVKWEQTMHILYERPVDIQYPQTFECGPGQSLKAMLNMINKQAGYM
ncbi:probable malonyl-CoA-acyl carrier protein transacylase, mitochondrial isoform X2 [Artemia franciscana]